MKIQGFRAAMLLLVVINGAVLAGVAGNRSGEPDAVVVLTERELKLSHQEKENSSVALLLNWRHFPDGEPEWFNKEKLEAVGFDCRTPLNGPDATLRYQKVLPRRTYAVLEYEGAAWEAWRVKEEKKIETLVAKVAVGTATRKELAAAQKRSSWYQTSGSRLSPIDVGNDPKKLRQTYPDRSCYIITPAKVRLNFRAPGNGQPFAPAKLFGTVEQVLTDTIQVPRNKVGSLTTMQASRRRAEYFEGFNEEPHAPRYQVLVKYGKRCEPWVEAVQSLGKQSR